MSETSVVILDGEDIDSEWAWMLLGDPKSMKTQTIYMRRVTLDLRVPVCDRNLDYPLIKTRCRLPPGHESADIMCAGFSAPDPPGKFCAITRVTNQDPRHAEANRTSADV